MAQALSNQEKALLDAYWRAANYLSVGQIYLHDNPLLKEPLAKENIGPRLLGHWERLSRERRSDPRREALIASSRHTADPDRDHRSSREGAP